jgi:hypothetical protein
MGRAGLTEKQEQTLLELEAKEKRTVLQEKTMLDLINKRDNPDLPEGAKTHLRNWSRSKLYSRTKEINSKYLKKGREVEDTAIDMLAEYLDCGFLFKNEEYFDDDQHMKGTPDVLVPKIVFEVKSSWTWETFPAFESDVTNPLYPWQCQGYMGLTKREHAKLCYVLVDTPAHIIEKECRIKSYELGMGGEYDQEFYDEIAQKMTYSDIPLELRIKIFDIPRDDKAIESIRKRVELCRVFLSQLQF